MLVLKGAKRPVKAITFSPDGNLLASAGGEGFVRLWNALDGQPLGVVAEQTGRGPDDSILRFAPNSRHLVVSGALYALSVWDVQERKLVKQLTKPSNVVCDAGIGFAPDGRLLAAQIRHGRWTVGVELDELGGIALLWKPRRVRRSTHLMAVEPGGRRAAVGNGLLLDVHTGGGNWPVGRAGP